MQAQQRGGGNALMQRRSTQKVINFPIDPKDVDRDMLSPMYPFGTEDSDSEQPGTNQTRRTTQTRL